MELIEFLRQTQQQIQEETIAQNQETGSDAAYPELIFTEIVTRHMAEIGMTLEPEVCPCDIGTQNRTTHRLSGFAISENMDQLDLYVSLYSGTDIVSNISDSETTKAAEQCAQFLSMCVKGELIAKMDESAPAYPLAMTIHQAYQSIEQIRIFVLTDRLAKTRVFAPREIAGKQIKLEVMDIQRLFNHWQEGKPRDELVVNFQDVAGAPLPCIWVPDQMGEYDYAMTAIPGEALRYLYEKYGARILEANVRSFLSQVGNVNKGIRDTLRNQPERFMAYNNGVVIIADEACFEKTEDGGLGISWLKGMQVVNGGQTTASMFFTKKKYPDIDLKQVRVPAKIIILKNVGPAEEEKLITDISRYANSQNAVKASDLSANKPYHVALEKLAMSTFCPDGVGRWFYERAAGSYKVMLEREGKTPAGIKRLQETLPTGRKITKTDLAKYLCAWEQRPELVSLGGQKNFTAFMEMVSGEEHADPDASEFKRTIAKVILFKEGQKKIRPRFPAFQANVLAYTISILSRKIGDRLDLDAIWTKQSISPELGHQIEIWSDEVNSYLHETSNGKMISEWAKRKECWDRLSLLRYSSPIDGIPEIK